jgi:hypothetical protein
MQHGLTLQNLAELTGYSWQHLGAVERGQVVPSENLIVRAVAQERRPTAHTIWTGSGWPMPVGVRPGSQRRSWKIWS